MKAFDKVFGILGAIALIIIVLNLSLTDPPHNTVNLVSPANATWTQATNDTLQFTFNRTATLTGIVNCTLYVNHTYANHQDGCSAGTNYNFFSTILLAEGVSPWYVNATNGTTSNDVEQSVIRTLYVDRSSPTITLATPVNNRVFANSEVDVNFTASDSDLGTLNVTIYRNGTALTNFTDMWVSNGAATMRKINFTDGRWNVYVNVTDNVTKTARTIQSNFTVDTTAPASLTFVSPTPANLTSYNVSSITWAFINLTFTEGSLDRCLLEWRNNTGRVNQSMTNSANSCTLNMTNQGPEEARYVVIINDTANNTARSILRVVSFDSTTAPTVSFDLPVEGYNQSNTTVNLSFSVGDTWTTQMSNCTITVNATSTYLVTNLLNNTVYNVSIGGFVDNSTNNWTVSCFDGIGMKSSPIANRNFTINTRSPTSLTYNVPTPVDGFNTTGTTVLFNWTVVDVYSNTLNCSVNLNGTTNITVSTTNNAPTTVNISNTLADGIYNWNVSCSGTSGLGISTNRTFSVDTTAPTVTLDKSLNISSSNHRLAFFNLTLTDVTTDINTCYARVKYDDGSYGVNVTGVLTTGTLTRLCNITVSAGDITRYGRITFQIFGTDTTGNTGNVTNIKTENWTAIQLIGPSWNLISVDKNSTYNQTSNLTGLITSVSKYNNTGKTYTTYVSGITTNNGFNLSDGEAVYVYNNATQNVTIMRLWSVDVARNISQNSNITQIVRQGWNQIATFNNSVMTLSGVCNLPSALNKAPANGSIAYASYYASNESKYFSYRCGFTFNSGVRVPKGTGVWINLNGSVTGFNQTFTIWRDA